MFYVQYSNDGKNWYPQAKYRGHKTLELAKSGARCAIAFSPKNTYARVVSRNAKKVFAQYKIANEEEYGKEQESIISCFP